MDTIAVEYNTILKTIPNEEKLEKLKYDYELRKHIHASPLQASYVAFSEFFVDIVV